MNLSNQIKDLLIEDVRVRIFDECFPRIKQCLGELKTEEIWHKPNEQSNSIGNLVLHVCGNLRQYVLSGLGKQNDYRNRDAEFSNVDGMVAAELIQKMDALQKEMDAVLLRISDQDLIQPKNIQGFKLNTISVLIHVTEHLSYHTGQIAFYTKLLKNIDLKFYGDLDLTITGG